MRCRNSEITSNIRKFLVRIMQKGTFNEIAGSPWGSHVDRNVSNDGSCVQNGHTNQNHALCKCRFTLDGQQFALCNKWNNITRHRCYTPMTHHSSMNGKYITKSPKTITWHPPTSTKPTENCGDVNTLVQ